MTKRPEVVQDGKANKILCQSCYTAGYSYETVHLSMQESGGYEPVMWIKKSSKSDLYHVWSMPDEKQKTHFIGIIGGATLRRLVRGEIKGCPIKSDGR